MDLQETYLAQNRIKALSLLDYFKRYIYGQIKMPVM